MMTQLLSKEAYAIVLEKNACAHHRRLNGSSKQSALQ